VVGGTKSASSSKKAAAGKDSMEVDEDGGAAGGTGGGGGGKPVLGDVNLGLRRTNLDVRMWRPYLPCVLAFSSRTPHPHHQHRHHTHKPHTTHDTRHTQQLRFPLENGHVRDWDAVEAIWRHAFTELLVPDGAKGAPFLYAIPTWTTHAESAKMMELAFERFDVGALYLARSPVLRYVPPSLRPSVWHVTGIDHPPRHSCSKP
jgi:hypothetical protein